MVIAVEGVSRVTVVSIPLADAAVSAAGTGEMLVISGVFAVEVVLGSSSEVKLEAVGSTF